MRLRPLYTKRSRTALGVDGAAAPADYVTSVNRELPMLMVNSLDRVFAPNTDLLSLTITDTVIQAEMLR